MSFRAGIGHDIHRVAPDRPLVLGGVRIDAPFGLAGHSDADVVLHAVCDALLGAAGLGDIGELFPDSDPALRNADSRGFVRQVLKQIWKADWRPANVDVTILAEQPRLAPHRAAMRASIAELLDLPGDAVNVKAGTCEGLDAVGRGEAIACWAIVMLQRAP